MDPDPLIFDMLWEAEQSQPEDLNLDGFAEALFAILDEGEVELSLLVTDDAQMTELNEQYRGKAYTTDVLSFPADGELPPEGPRHIGDIVISLQQATRQAEEIGQPLAQEMRFLLLHGVLHLLGYDHETDDGEMLAYQSELKEQLGSFFELPGNT